MKTLWISILTVCDYLFQRHALVFYQDDPTIIPCNMPHKATKKSAGYDLFPAFHVKREPIVLPAGEVTMVTTGCCVSLPKNTFLDIRTRSSMGSKGIIVANSPGTIDEDYTGVVKVLLYNTTKEDYVIKVSDKTAIAQAILQKEASHTFIDELHSITGKLFHRIYNFRAVKEKTRGSGGFGSTNK